jgi:hypothetical protein
MSMGICIGVAAILFAALVWTVKLLLDARKSLSRFAEITSVEDQKRSIEQAILLAEDKARLLDNDVKESEARAIAARNAMLSVEEALDLQSFGFYRAHYDLESSDAYAKRLDDIRAEQKALIKSDKAAHCPTDWTVAGSAAKGKKMVKEHVKLMLRAFNGECDAAVAKVKYNNVSTLENRITKAFESINDLGSTVQIQITVNYFNLKMAELRLVHEHREKQYEEQEEQRRIREQLREEEKAEAELAKEKADAEKEEVRQQKALEKARKELADATGQQHAKLEELVKKLETELAAAIDRKAKAIARAQLTKSGHVYVLSNIGSFGDGVYKIGMTRRFEPLERVKELGAASVPFYFDVHAMIYTADAPALEHALHREFEQRRVNRINMRREYFRVTLDEIHKAVAKHHGIVTFVTEPPAEEFRKTRAMENEAPQAKSA